MERADKTHTEIDQHSYKQKTDRTKGYIEYQSCILIIAVAETVVKSVKLFVYFYNVIITFGIEKAAVL